MGDVLFSLMENWTKYNKYSLSWDIRISPPLDFLVKRKTSLFGDHLLIFTGYVPMMGGYLNHWQRTIE